MNSRWIDIKTEQGETFSGYLSLPPAGTGPAIVLVQEIWGVNEHIRAVADQYALSGYVVLAPDVFWRLQPRLDLNYDDAGNAIAFDLYGKIDTDKATQDIAASIATLRKLPEVTGKVATLGYCLGGQLAYRGAVAGHADAAVAYYGGGIDKHLDIVNQVNMPILFHYAMKDAHITQDIVNTVKAAFAGKSNATFIDYPETGHGFNCWGRTAVYNQRAAALAQAHTLEFLSTHL
ncbi:MAG: dienelactone hydrolase family protein [Burkholderiales bacterium]|nr:dienelactone hydrolase family protein [Burkholderiales bacterium]